MEGRKDALGLWIAEHEGAKFWLRVLNDLKNRGVQDILVACCDGLSGFPEAIETIFPKALAQLRVVHMIRNSLKYVAHKDYGPVCRDLKPIYLAPTLQEAQRQLENFSSTWEAKYPTVPHLWRKHWDRLTPFFSFPQEIRRLIYTTNPIESLNHSLRGVLKNKGSFPNEESVLKLLYLALLKISKKWTQPAPHWKTSLNIFYPDVSGPSPSTFFGINKWGTPFTQIS